MKKRKTGLSFYEPKKRVNPTVFSEIIICALLMAIAVFVAVVLVYFYGMSNYVVGSSMEPTLYNGQKILVNRFAYVISKPKVGDIVVFLPHGNEKSHYYVKRIVAGPGDSVQIIEGRLYVNGVLSETITKEMEFAGIAENMLTMQKGQYFCVGDNPADGEDSRQANIGPVDKKDIVGRAWLRMKHLNIKMGLVK